MVKTRTKQELKNDIKDIESLNRSVDFLYDFRDEQRQAKETIIKIINDEVMWLVIFGLNWVETYQKTNKKAIDFLKDAEEERYYKRDELYYFKNQFEIILTIKRALGVKN